MGNVYNTGDTATEAAASHTHTEANVTNLVTDLATASAPTGVGFRLSIFPALETPAANSGALTYTTSSTFYIGVLESAGASTNSASWNVLLPAGTYTMEVVYVKGTDRGIQQWALDDGAGNYTNLDAAPFNASASTIDGYNGAIVANNRTSFTGIVIGSTIKRSLRVTTPTKNASASAYYFDLHAMHLRRTA